MYEYHRNAHVYLPAHSLQTQSIHVFVAWLLACLLACVLACLPACLASWLVCRLVGWLVDGNSRIRGSGLSQDPRLSEGSEAAVHISSRHSGPLEPS